MKDAALLELARTDPNAFLVEIDKQYRAEIASVVLSVVKHADAVEDLT